MIKGLAFAPALFLDSDGTMDTPETPERARFFGRSKGKTLRKAQAIIWADGLSRLKITLGPQPLDPVALFAWSPKAIRLEIGFGGGEHLIHRATENPDTGFIGVEPFVNGMAKLLMEVDKHQIGNIRVFDEDATRLLRKLPPGSIAEIDLLYADPWPKRRQRKRRFVSEESLGLIARALIPGGIFRFASDIDDYVGWMLARILPMAEFRWDAMAAPDWTTPYAGWPGTRYEAKAIKEGRIPSYLTFRRAET
jgi:tRNA (guanine-N7-)-methyltransferase